MPFSWRAHVAAVGCMDPLHWRMAAVM
jgi:hypothetical protein